MKISGMGSKRTATKTRRANQRFESWSVEVELFGYLGRQEFKSIKKAGMRVRQNTKIPF